MNSPSKETEEPTSSNEVVASEADAGDESGAREPGGGSSPRPPAKRRLSAAAAVIEISDTESDDSDICAVTSYQATADEVKRIRGADYSSSSSSSDYSSDSESPWEDDSIVIEDDKPIKVVRAQLNPRANRMDDPKLNPALKSQEVIDRLTTHWKELKDHSTEEVTLTSEPFRLCLLHEFLANPEIINNIIDDMNTLDWSRKKMDLYEFHQTTDLASLTWQRGIKGIYELLKTEVMNWVSQVTGLELRTVSASCSLYGPGDHLLVHDDLEGDRRVAFILYLAPWRPCLRHYTQLNGGGDHLPQVDVEAEGGGWAAHMGGALELLARDPDGCPAGVAHTVYPRNNMLAFFKVGADSFHQVSEVVSLELPRLSINGWFHGPPPPADPAAPEPPEPPAPPLPEEHRLHSEVVVLQQWVDSAYMSPRARAQLQAQMEQASEACLTGFLLPERRAELLAALTCPEVPWERVGPPNQRHYWRVPPAWPPAQPAAHVLRALLHALASSTFARLLTDCTDLALTTYSRLEIQRFGAHDYTLLPPRSHYQHARLEAVMYVGVPARALCGGSTTYVAPEENSLEDGGALVTLPPRSDALNLVYCDTGSASFIKYLSKMTMREDEYFYVVTCTYRE